MTTTSEQQAVKIKEGQLLFYKPRCFGSNWRRVDAILYSDSSFFFYVERSYCPCFAKVTKTVKLANVAPFIVTGQFTNRLRNRPELPSYATASNLIAIGTGPPNAPVLWFLAQSEDDFTAWWTSILSTLPPPPPLPLPQLPTGQQPQRYAPTVAGYQQQPYVPQQSGYQQPPSQAQAPASTTTTVVVTPGSSGAGGWGTGPGFGTGALLGGLVGYNLGTMSGHWGWGAGCGYAGYPGYYSDVDTTVIQNYYGGGGNVGNFGDSGGHVDFDTGGDTDFGDFGDFGGGGDW